MNQATRSELRDALHGVAAAVEEIALDLDDPRALELADLQGMLDRGLAAMLVIVKARAAIAAVMRDRDVVAMAAELADARR